MTQASSAQEATTFPMGEAATARREPGSHGREHDTPVAADVRPGARDRSAPLLERAGELVRLSRSRIASGHLRVERSQALLIHNHQRLMASQGTGSDVVRHVVAEISQLRQALESRATIDQAKGIVMAERGCDADHAFDVLVSVSQSTNVKVRDVAAMVVARAAQRRGHLIG